MRILFIVGDLESGGAEKVISTLANSFSFNNDVEILMISTDKHEPFYDINSNVKLVPLLLKGKRLSHIKKIKEIRREITSFSPDVVISFLNYVIVYSWLAIKKIKKKNFKFVVSERNNPYKVPSTYIYRKLRNYIFSKADGCVFQTKDANDYFKKLKSASIIPNPVFLTRDTSFDYLNNEREKTVLMVGSNKKEKNRIMAYKAFSIFNSVKPNYKLLVVGSKPTDKELFFVNKIGISKNVQFVGKDSEWHKHYQSVSMYVLSSDYEGMPNALLEAAALQIPSISTNCPIGGPKEILKGGERGVLIKVGDYKKLAEEMIRVAGSKEIQDYYSNQCSSIAGEYDAQNIANMWIEYIKSI